MMSPSSEHDAPDVYILIRQTLDWRDETRVRDRILPEFRPKFDAWNATFTMPYHVFRQRLTAIAQLNLGHVDAVLVSRIDDIPDGAIVVPVDDDDWFAPDLGADVRRAYEPGAVGYLWQRTAIEYTAPGIAVRRWVTRLIGREKYVCKTNNYAVRYTPDLATVAANHVRASAFFRAHAPDVRRIPATLAVQNRSLASQTTLAWGRPAIGRDELIRLFEKHRQLYTSWAPPRELAWAAPYVAMMADLMADVKLLG